MTKMKMSGNNWLPLLGYKGFYEISDNGQVRSIDRFIIDSKERKYFIKGKLKKLSTDRDGYKVFKVHKDNKSKTLKVHREILKSFRMINDHDKYQVNHINGKKDDNRICNLEWCTAGWNSWHYNYSHERTLFNRSKILSDEQVISVAKMFLSGSNVKEISSSFGVNQSVIRSIIHVKTNRPLLVASELTVLLAKELLKRRESSVSLWANKNFERLRDSYRFGVSRDVLRGIESISDGKIKAAFRKIKETYPDDYLERRQNIYGY